jgi:hypothetical protein
MFGPLKEAMGGKKFLPARPTARQPAYGSIARVDFGRFSVS